MLKQTSNDRKLMFMTDAVEVRFAASNINNVIAPLTLI